jgi:hypothetical protein
VTSLQYVIRIELSGHISVLRYFSCVALLSIRSPPQTARKIRRSSNLRLVPPHQTSIVECSKCVILWSRRKEFTSLFCRMTLGYTQGWVIIAYTSLNSVPARTISVNHRVRVGGMLQYRGNLTSFILESSVSQWSFGKCFLSLSPSGKD